MEAGQAWGDRVALAASAICLIHCLVLPGMLAALPLAAAYLALPETFHIWAALVAVPTSAVALRLGWRHHRRREPVLLAIPGLLLLGTGAAAPEGAPEMLLSVSGAVLVAVGHLANRRLGRGNQATRSCV